MKVTRKLSCSALSIQDETMKQIQSLSTLDAQTQMQPAVVNVCIGHKFACSRRVQWGLGPKATESETRERPREGILTDCAFWEPVIVDITFVLSAHLNGLSWLRKALFL